MWLALMPGLISQRLDQSILRVGLLCPGARPRTEVRSLRLRMGSRDRKSTRLNSSHSQNSYAVFCLKTKRRVEPLAVQLEGSTALQDEVELLVPVVLLVVLVDDLVARLPTGPRVHAESRDPEVMPDG